MSEEATGFLYPFIESEERDASALLTDLASSARSKFAISRDLRAGVLATFGPELRKAGRDMADRFAAGGRLFTFGNGGSATDAESAVDLFRRPASGRPLPAICLVDDRAVLTALANDVGFELVFSRQLIAHARPGDVALGFSTSGDSRNVLAGFRQAAGRGVLTVGLSGYQGGAMATSADLDYLFVVPSDSVHRIQEAQDAVVFRLWSEVQDALSAGGEDP